MHLTTCPAVGLFRAVIERVEGNRLLVALNGAQAWASDALGYAYQFQAGDAVLVIGENEDWYVIGILEGKGKTAFHAPGDLELVATGSLTLVAGESIELKGRNINVVATRLNLMAKRLTQRAESLRLHVRNAFQVFAARFSSRIEGAHRVEARRIVERAREDVTIDGSKIHLG